MSKCGFPALDANNPNIDVTVIKQEAKALNEDVGDNETLPADSVAVAKPKNGKISFNMGEKQKKDGSCGKMRKLIVTITNIPPEPTTRILQATAPQSVSLTFSSSEGTESASSGASKFFYNAALAFVALMMFAF
jgi:hypothetical protein